VAEEQPKYKKRSPKTQPSWFKHFNTYDLAALFEDDSVRANAFSTSVRLYTTAFLQGHEQIELDVMFFMTMRNRIVPRAIEYYLGTVEEDDE
jgi:hypothetical protein